MQINVHPIDVASCETVGSLRLAQRDGKPHLLVARGYELSEAELPSPGSSNPLTFTAAGTLGGLPSWDAKAVPGRRGSYSTLFVRAESAVAWAMVQTPIPPLETRLHLEPFAIYDHPSFAKGQTADQWSVIAVSYVDEVSIPVVFPRGGIEGNDPPSISVGRFSRTIEDIRLLKTTADHWLFLLQRDPESDVEVQPRQLPTGRRMPAVVSVVHLDAALQPTAPAVKVFGSTPIYEFDVDAAADGSAVVFATTSEGALFARGVLAPGKPLPSNAWAITEMPAPLASPSVLVNGGLAHVAAISNLGLPQAAVVYGAVQL